MSNLFETAFGIYEPIMFNGVPVEGISGVNFTYILECVMFIIMLNWVLKFVFSLFR